MYFICELNCANEADCQIHDCNVLFFAFESNTVLYTIDYTECKQFQSTSGPGCSKLTTLLVKVSLKFQTLRAIPCKHQNILATHSQGI